MKVKQATMRTKENDNDNPLKVAGREDGVTLVTVKVRNVDTVLTFTAFETGWRVVAEKDDGTVASDSAGPW